MDRRRAEVYFDSQAWIYDLTRRRFLRGRGRAVEALGVRPGDVVADWACGTGLNLGRLRAAGAARVIGVDASAKMLGIAKARYPEAELHQADITLFKPRENADRVICAYALSLVDAWEEAVANMAGSLAAGGRMVILDFHPMRGPLALLDPLIGWWVGVHGADTRREYLPVMQRHFKKVSEFVPRSGFYRVVIGE